MTAEILLSSCPVCRQEPLTLNNKAYVCPHCQLSLSQNASFLGLKPKNSYTVVNIGPDYSRAGAGLIGQKFSLAEIKNFSECVYTDAQLAQFAEGNYESITMPASTLAQVLLEQLRETCYLQVNSMRRGHGPVIPAGGSRIPAGKAPTAGLKWQDNGNLFLTDVRLVFPSNSFTFIRLDRKVIGLKTFTNGIALQRKGDDFASYFVGCKEHQAILIAAYIQGKVSSLREER